MRLISNVTDCFTFKDQSNKKTMYKNWELFYTNDTLFTKDIMLWTGAKTKNLES